MSQRKYVLLARGSILMLAVGLIAAFAGLFSYLTRYANLDSLDGSIDGAVYEQITQMFTQEKVFLAGGIALTIAGAVGLALSVAGRSRSAKLVS